MRFQYLCLSVILQACVVLPALAFPLRHIKDANELEFTHHKAAVSFRPGTQARTLATLEKCAHNDEASATIAYDHTKYKPHRLDTFRAVNGDVFTGENVDYAIKAFHLHDPVPNNHQHGSAGFMAQQPKPFRNYANFNGHSPYPYFYNPHNRPPRPAGLYEFPLVHEKGGYHEGSPGEARIIMHKNHDGSHYFVGVVSHPPPHAAASQHDHYRAQHVPHR